MLIQKINEDIEKIREKETIMKIKENSLKKLEIAFEQMLENN